ncbi:MAG TPA: hypothetical protein VGK67_20970 [Myxococcales bacterium]|jgi:hypothetical protein
MEIFQLNNRASGQIRAGLLDEAEATLDQVGRVLASRYSGPMLRMVR